jgi:hypothetical protein
MAATALRLVMDPEMARKVKDEHAMWVAKYSATTPSTGH